MYRLQGQDQGLLLFPQELEQHSITRQGRYVSCKSLTFWCRMYVVTIVGTREGKGGITTYQKTRAAY
jgi:hypothetical protein